MTTFGSAPIRSFGASHVTSPCLERRCSDKTSWAPGLQCVRRSELAPESLALIHHAAKPFVHYDFRCWTGDVTDLPVTLSRDSGRDSAARIMITDFGN